MGFLESFWTRFANAGTAASPTSAVSAPSADTARRRIVSVAVRCLEELGSGIFADPERVRWILLQPEVDGAVRKFTSLVALGESRAEEALQARESLKRLLAADLPGEFPEHIEMLLDLVQTDSRHLATRGAMLVPPVPPARPMEPAPEPEPLPVVIARHIGSQATHELEGADDPFAPLLEAEAIRADRRADARRSAEGSPAPQEYELSVLPGTTVADAELALVREYVRAATRRRPSSALSELRDTEALLALRAIEGPPGRERLTVLGALFFARRPERVVVQSKVRFVEFPGTDVASGGETLAYKYSEEVTGTIPQLVARIERLHKERLAPGVLADGFRLEELPAVPLFALREAIVNAVCHRDYSLVGANIQVRLFDDRLEVQSPGGLPGPVTVDNILVESYARNPRVADMLRDLGYVERHGLGIDNMVKTMKDAHLPPPEFANTDTSFTVTLRFRLADEAAPEAWLAGIGAGILAADQQRLLVCARRTGRVSDEALRSLDLADSAEADANVRELVRDGWLVKHGARGEAYFTLGPTAGSAAGASGGEGRAEPGILASLTKSQRRVYDIVARQGRARASDVLDISGLKDRRTIQRALGALTERGLLVRHATSPTDPNASYEVNGGADASRCASRRKKTAE